MRKKNISYFTFSLYFLVCASSIFLALQNRKLQNQVRIHKSASEAIPISSQLYVEEMTKYYLNEGLNYSKELQVYSFNEMKKLALSSFAVNEPILVLRILGKDCSSCIDSLFVLMKSVLSDINDKQILVLTDEKNPRKVMVNQRLHGFSYPTCYIEEGEIPISIESETPYFFVTDSSISIKLLHKFDPSIPKLTQNYLQIIKKRFFLNRPPISVHKAY